MGWTPPHPLIGIECQTDVVVASVGSEEESAMEIIRVGVDLAKNVFQLHGVDEHEKPVWKRSLRRGQWLRELQGRVAPGAEIGMEACAGAHHWGRQLRARGYRVKLMAPQFDPRASPTRSAVGSTRCSPTNTATS